MQIYFFGCSNGQIGHFFFAPGWRSQLDFPPGFPWEVVDAVLPPGPRDRFGGGVPRVEQVEGRAALHRAGGWTALAWWDRSVDRRYASNAALFAEGEHTAEELLAAARAAFPGLMERLSYEVRCEGRPERTKMG